MYKERGSKNKENINGQMRGTFLIVNKILGRVRDCVSFARAAKPGRPKQQKIISLEEKSKIEGSAG